MKRPSAITRQHQKHGHTRHRHKVERKQKYKLDYLPERKGRIDRACSRFSEPLDGVDAIGMDDSFFIDHSLKSFIYKHGIEDVDQRLIDEKCFKQQRDYCGPFAEDEECAVHPGAVALEDGEKCDLWEVGEEEEKGVDEAG